MSQPLVRRLEFAPRDRTPAQPLETGNLRLEVSDTQTGRPRSTRVGRPMPASNVPPHTVQTALMVPTIGTLQNNLFLLVALVVVPIYVSKINTTIWAHTASHLQNINNMYQRGSGLPGSIIAIPKVIVYMNFRKALSFNCYIAIS